MGQPDVLYMFAIMPPAELSAKIHNERLNFAEEYKFVKALKPPVHITLYPPFKIPKGEAIGYEQSCSSIQNWANHQTSFKIELKDFNFFTNPRSPILYIDVVKSEQLKELHSSFLMELKKYLGIERNKDPYKPHFTIGYRDIDPKVFPEIKAAYSKRRFRDQFICEAIYLWRHDGKNWQVIQKYELKGIQPQQSLF